MNEISQTSIECPCFDVHHFVMYFRKELKVPEQDELVQHCFECKPCQTIWKKVAEIMIGKADWSRAEQLAFFRHIGSPVWSIEMRDLFRCVKKMTNKKVRRQLRKANKGC